MSCKGQKSSDLDLSRGILGKHIDSILTPNIKTINDFDSYGVDKDSRIAVDKEVLCFNGVNISGFFKENTNYLKNSVTFFFTKQNKRILGYDIKTYQTEKSNLLIQQLEQLLGKPNFIGYFNKEAREKNEFDAKVWEDKVNNCTYLLNTTIQKNGKECWLFILDNTASYFYNRVLGLAEFNRWEKFKKYKKRFEKPESYTYQDYIKYKTEKGDKYISILSE